MAVVVDGDEYSNLVEAASYYAAAPQQMYLRPRQMIGFPRPGRLPGHRGLFFRADELREFTLDYARRNPGKTLFASVELAIRRGAVSGAILSPEGEAAVERVLEEWLRLHGAGRQEHLREFLAALAPETENA